MNRIKVFIVDDHSILRDGLATLLYKYDDIQVEGDASSGESAIQKLEKLDVDVILMDINLTGLSGIDVTEELLSKNPKYKIIILSMDLNSELVEKCIKAGALGYLPKNCNRNVLIEAIRTVNNGDKYFDESISKLVFEQFYKRSIPKSESYSQNLSGREREILVLIVKGHSNTEIAEKLFISVRTVDTHKTNIMKKLKLKSFPQLMKFALSNELITIEDII